jgi:hypothetical protein
LGKLRAKNLPGRSIVYKKILAPLDGSGFSECSLEHVGAVATDADSGDLTTLEGETSVEEIIRTYHELKKAKIKTE